MDRLTAVVSSFVACKHPQAARLRLIVVTESPAAPETGATIQAWCSQCGSMQLAPDVWRATVGRAELGLAALDSARRAVDELDLLDQAAVASRELARSLGEVASLSASGHFQLTADTLRHLQTAALSMADGFARLGAQLVEQLAKAEHTHDLAKASVS